MVEALVFNATAAKKLVNEISNLSPAKLFDCYEQDAKWFRQTAAEGEFRFIRAAASLHRITGERLWQKRISKQTKKPFETIDQWISEEGGMSRAKIYSLIRLKESFEKVPVGKLLELGVSRANELARLHKTLPDILPKAVDRVLSKKMDVREVKAMVANSLAGEHLDSGRYVVVELSVKAEDHDTVLHALAVAQARTPLESPDGASADGCHMVEICREYLQDPASEKVFKQLEKAGAFKKNGFLLEE